jgi:hypothetical protein
LKLFVESLFSWVQGSAVSAKRLDQVTDSKGETATAGALAILAASGKACPKRVQMPNPRILANSSRRTDDQRASYREIAVGVWPESTNTVL